MTLRVLVVLVLCAATAIAAPSATQLAKDRAAAAEKVFRGVVAQQKAGQATVESVHQWSVRWLDAAIDSGEAKKQALADHVTRMTELEALAIKMKDAGVLATSDADAATYFRIESELWQARGKAH